MAQQLHSNTHLKRSESLHTHQLDSRMFLAHFFIPAPNQKQLKCACGVLILWTMTWWHMSTFVWDSRNKQIHPGERQIRSVLIRGDGRWPVRAKGCEISLRSCANHLVLLGFNCQLDSLGSPERGSLSWGISQGRGACEHVYGEIVCTNNWYRCFQPTMGSTIARQVVLGSIKDLVN